MYFRTKNFGIEDFEREQFEAIAEKSSPVACVASCALGTVFAQDGNAVWVRGSGDTKRIAKFDRNMSALCASGDVVACGDEGGMIKIVGGMKSVVRQYHEHEAAVNDLKIHGNLLVSCSDDMRIKVFDISGAASISTICDNTDYVKSIDIAGDILFSGSYDRLVHGHCLKTFQRVFSHRAKGPVSRICCMDGGRLAYASRNELFVIDTGSADAQPRTRPMHTKEITQMTYYGGRLYTASLDASIRVLTDDLKLVSRVGCRSGVLCFSIFGDVLCLGMEDGGVLRLVKDRPAEERTFVEREHALRDKLEISVLRDEMKKYDDLERRFRRFEYKKSLLGAVDERDIQKLFAAMTFIQEKREFEHALLDLDRAALGRVLDAVIEFFGPKELVPAFVECIETVLALYERDILDDCELAQKIDVLAAVVSDEVRFQEQNLRTISFLECFLG